MTVLHGIRVTGGSRQRRRTWIRHGLLACLLVLLPVAAGAGDGEAGLHATTLQPRTGHAFDLETGALLYREVHEPIVENGRLLGDRVRYLDPGGATFARKRVDYRPNPVRPDFHLTDERSGYEEGLEALADGGVRVFHRPVGADRLRNDRIEPPAELVADAGFDIQIAREFERLRNGERIEMPFLVPSRGEWYRFRARPLRETEVLGEPALVIRMELSGWVGRMLTQSIDVSYHRDTRALLRYEGISNIRDGNGDSLRVRIDFPPDGRDPEPPG